MTHPRLHLLPLIALLLTRLCSSAFNASSNSVITAYWGQEAGYNIQGDYQESLAYYCANADADVFLLAFLVQIDTSGAGGQPVIDFANIDPTTVGQDIESCQTVFGKSVLLSMGGATSYFQGFPSPEIARAAAQQIWGIFGPPSPNTTVYNLTDNSTTPTAPLRPFGTAHVNGFDIDFMSDVSTNLVPFAAELRSLMDSSNETVLLTAAPQCPYPDETLNSTLNGGIYFDAIWVQFFNNYCSPTGGLFQFFQVWDMWDKWATTHSANPDVKVFFGTPGSPISAGNGYLGPSLLQSVVKYCQQFSNFGGVMVWDVSSGWDNANYFSTIQAILTT
jgi:chitinase